MKKTKLGRITAKLLALTMSMSLFTVLPAANAAAEESGTATITVYDENGSQVGASTNDLSAALGTAYSYPGSTVEIGEGTVYLDAGIYIQSNNIKVEGAGIDKSYIRPTNPDDYVNGLKKGIEPSGVTSYKHLFEVIGQNVTLKNMTIDGGEISGNGEYLDFVPLRLTGSAYGQIDNPGSVTLNSVKVKRTNNKGDKGSIQIGSGENDPTATCYVTAINSYVYGNTYKDIDIEVSSLADIFSSLSLYADIDICQGSTFTIEGGMFNGSILTADNTDETVKIKGDGYYSAKFDWKILANTALFDITKFSEKACLYTTIPYMLDCIEANTESGIIDNLLEILNKDDSLKDGANTIIQNMADDLDGADPQLYGLDCDGKRELAKRFYNDLSEYKQFDTQTTQVKDALDKDEDWHEWGNDNVCVVCNAEKASVYKTTSECVQRSDDAPLYGVRFVFEYDAGTIGSEAVDKFGAYVLDPSIFNSEDSVNNIQPLPENSTEVKYNDGQQLKDGETFSVDVIDIPAGEAGKTIYAIPFADSVFGEVASQEVNVVDAQSIE